ncbi:MAG: FAD:protein FMN transferase, partial [Planctomycetes bacterium]|nr:FAD:protein FMN transferase [Planctomycetota bacterium]
MVTSAAGLRIDFRAMYGNIAVLVDGDHGVENVGEVMGWFADWERRFSRFLPRSELAQLNTNPAETVPISPLLFDVLSTALYAAHVTDGLVTQTVLDALERAGYDHSFELLTAVTKTAPRRAPVRGSMMWCCERSPCCQRRRSGAQVAMPPEYSGSTPNG